MFKSISNSLLIAIYIYMVLVTGFSCRQKKEESVVYGSNAKAGNYREVKGIKIYYEIYGEGKPLLLLHGNDGSIYSMRMQIPYFAKHYQVIAIDSRSQGKTIDNRDSLSYDQIAADINGLLDQLKIDSTYIIGQSDGAIAGLIMAIRYPAKVKMLVAMAPNTRPDSAVLYPSVEKESITKLAKYEDSLKAGHKQATNGLKLLRLMQDHPHISDTELATINAPVMVMCGDRDVIQLSHIIEIFRSIPKSNLCVLPGSTHTALRQNTDVFNENIHRFFSRPFIMPNSF